MASTTTAIAVMGAGAWGTALAKVLVDAGGPETAVRLWARRSDIAEQINSTRYNPDYLPGTSLPPGIRATADAGWHEALTMEEFAEPVCFTTAAFADNVRAMLAKSQA